MQLKRFLQKTAAAGLLGIDIGQATMYGAFAAVFMTMFGWIFAEIYFRNKPDSFYSFREVQGESREEADMEDKSPIVRSPFQFTDIP